MARPIKKGLDYFPLDVDFLKDIKVRKIMRANGNGSISVLIDLLGNIYRDEGYYIQWDDDLRFLIADDVGASEVYTDEVVTKAVQVGLFNQSMFEQYKILTSRGIQKRYQQASARKTDNAIKNEYSLLYTETEPLHKETELLHTETPLSGVNVRNNTPSVGFMTVKSTQSKVKESKVNKTKVNNINDDDDNHDLSSTVSAINHWQEVYGGLNAVQMEDLQNYRLEFQDELVNEAIDRTARVISANQRGGAFTYMAKILKSWKQAGVKTLADIAKADKRYEQTKPKPTYSNGYKRPKTKEIATDWSKKKPVQQSESEEELNAKIDKMMALMDGESQTETGE